MLTTPEQLVASRFHLTHDLIGGGADVFEGEVRVVHFHCAALLMVLDDCQTPARAQASLHRRQHPLRVIEMVIGVQHDYEVGSAGRQLGINFRPQDKIDVAKPSRLDAIAGTVEEVGVYILGDDTPSRPHGKAQVFQQSACTSAQIHYGRAAGDFQP